jgi:hypothetical protein
VTGIRARDPWLASLSLGEKSPLKKPKKEATKRNKSDSQDKKISRNFDTANQNPA